jgi:hypothetical protein
MYMLFYIHSCDLQWQCYSMDWNVKEAINSRLHGVIFSHSLFRFHLHFINKQNIIVFKRLKLKKKIYSYLFIHVQGRAALIHHFDLCSTKAAHRKNRN